MVDIVYRSRVHFNVPNDWSSQKDDDFYDTLVEKGDPSEVADELLLDEMNMYIEAEFDSFAVALIWEEKIQEICKDWNVEVIDEP